jgi:nitroreductase
MDIFEAIKNRRSIRHYKNDRVDDDTIKAILEAAHWAPSWGNTQCWRFIIVREPATKSKIADTLMKIKVENELIENAAAGAVKNAPVLLVICAEMGKAGFSHDGSVVTDKGDWFLFDIGLVTQNLVLAAHAVGLGTVIVGGFDAKAVAKILDISEGFQVVTMTPLGFPARKGQISPRKSISEVVYREKFGK